MYSHGWPSELVGIDAIPLSSCVTVGLLLENQADELVAPTLNGRFPSRRDRLNIIADIV